jgi:hypothetical protein
MPCIIPAVKLSPVPTLSTILSRVYLGPLNNFILPFALVNRNPVQPLVDADKEVLILMAKKEKAYLTDEEFEKFVRKIGAV